MDEQKYKIYRRWYFYSAGENLFIKLYLTSSYIFVFAHGSTLTGLAWATRITWYRLSPISEGIFQLFWNNNFENKEDKYTIYILGEQK